MNEYASETVNGSKKYGSARSGGLWAKSGAATVGVLLLHACGNPPMAPEPTLVPALIDGYEAGDPFIRLEVQDDILLVSVLSFGNACREKGELETSVDNDARSVAVAVYDYFYATPCDDPLREFHHSASLRLDRAGSWIVKVAGHDVSHDNVRFEFAIEVSPESAAERNQPARLIRSTPGST